MDRENREGSHSGLVHHLGKVAGPKGPREFESLTLRNDLFTMRSVCIVTRHQYEEEAKLP